MKKLMISLALIFTFVGCTPAKQASTEATNPVVPPAVTVTVHKIAVGEDKVMAITSSGVAQSWGSNYEGINGTYGQLGLGLATNTTRTSPQVLDAGVNYLSIVSSEIVSCGITSDQRIKCWGDSVGDGSGTVQNSPAYINDGAAEKYFDLSAGSYHACAIQISGVVKCWGDGYEGKLGNGDGSGQGQASPVTADAGTTYKKIGAGRNHTCGITSNDEIKCWGTNDHGQIGINSAVTPQVTPMNVNAGTKYKDLFVGEDSNCAIDMAGALYCWGLNNVGQLGNGATGDLLLPTLIDLGVNYINASLSATFGFHTCGITTAGVLKCWGDNTYGQLGVNGTTSSLVPVIVNAGTLYQEISATYTNTCGITTTGTLKCWGRNSVGQLGIGDTAAHVGPQVVGTGY